MYTWAKIDKDVREGHLFESDSDDPVSVDDLREVEQFEIIDSDGDQIGIVHSQSDAEAIVSHLNR
jgi:translation initiation factor IF-3